MENEDEATRLVLESLGSKLASTSTYEASVIRNATLSSAPSLTGIGFPDLREIAPSFQSKNKNLPQNLRSDIPHIKTILTRTSASLKNLLSSTSKDMKSTRKSMYSNNEKYDDDLKIKVWESKEANLLRMKIQILSQFLQIHAPYHDRPKQNKLNSNDNNFIDIMSKSEWETIKEEQRLQDKQRRSILLSSSLSTKKTKLYSPDQNGSHKVEGKGKRSSSKSNIRMSRTQRLEGIKDGSLDLVDAESVEDKNSCSFGAQILLLRQNPKSMMQWKQFNVDKHQQQLKYEEGQGLVEDEYWNKIYRQKQQRRKERRERRQQRREKLQKENQSNSEDTALDNKNKKYVEHNNEYEQEIEWDENLTKENEEFNTNSPILSMSSEHQTNDDSMTTRKSKNTSLSTSSTISDNENSMIAQNEEKAVSKSSVSVSCPLCQRTFPLPATNKNSKNSDEIANEFLSKHMDRCQRMGRKRKTVGAYVESDEGIDLKESEKSIQNINSDNDTEEENIAFDKKIYDDKETKNSNDSPNKMLKEKRKGNVHVADKRSVTKENKTNRSSEMKTQVKKRNKSKSKISSRKNNTIDSVDDFELYVYTDRVEEWIDDQIINASLNSTNKMAEQDPNEKPPGMAFYPPSLIIPAWINNRLFTYQRTGLKWMYELHKQESGGIIGDEMGLGKTIQICAFLQSMILSRQVSSILIVCPATLLIHWMQELSKWAPGLRRILIHKAGEKADGFSREISTKLLLSLDQWISNARKECLNEPLNEEDLKDEEIELKAWGEGDYDSSYSFCGTGYVVVTTYENIRRKSLIWTDHQWDYVILDEGQKIRNPDADVTLSCKRFKTTHRLLLSGTPIQNDLRELWSLFDFVFPGRLGTLPTFETEFAEPIKRGGYSNAPPMQVQMAYRCALMLKDMINPYLLRRQKKDVKEVSRMPGKTEQVLFCRLSNRQRAMYKTYIASDEVKRIIRGSEQSFRAIMNLRKICNHPDLMGNVDERMVTLTSDSSSEEEDIDYDMDIINHSGKLEVLAKILPLWRKQGHRVLLFTQFKKMLNIVQKFVMAQDWKFFRMDGSTNVSSRQQMVDTFNADSSYFLMLMTTKTGGVGLNLTGADRIILYDPDWNPQTDAQARERAWRFGQKNDVTIYRLITAGTIEEKIYHRQIFKTAMSNQILQDPKQRRLFTRKDLKDLFTLKEDVHSIQGGGTGCTETGEITKGKGVVNPDKVEENTSNSIKDNADTLNTVLRSKGLAGIFEHDIISCTAGPKNIAQRELEAKAKLVAEEAAIRLEASVDDIEGKNQFIPTWTGSSQNVPKQFGTSKRGLQRRSIGNSERKKVKSKVSAVNDDHLSPKFEEEFGGAKIVGTTKSSALVGQSSSVLLSNLRRKKEQMMQFK